MYNENKATWFKIVYGEEKQGNGGGGIDSLGMAKCWLSWKHERIKSGNSLGTIIAVHMGDK